VRAQAAHPIHDRAKVQAALGADAEVRSAVDPTGGALASKPSMIRSTSAAKMPRRRRKPKALKNATCCGVRR
jgi:hypothetical protein